MESTSASSNRRGDRNRIMIENPFTLKVGQVFTGFGIGCGLGIGVGRPLNLGAIPMLNQVMSATSGATHALSGVSGHVNNSLRRLGAKNIEAGIGCGVGFGHGFGVGLAVKPGVIHKIQSSLAQGVMKMMTKLGVGSDLPFNQLQITQPLQGGTVPSNQIPIGNIMQLATKAPDRTSQGLSVDGNTSAGSSYEIISSKKPSTDSSYGSRTEKVISNFLQSPILKDEDVSNESVGRLRSETDVLYMVLKHQLLIEDLHKENEKLRQILVEELKVPPNKLQTSFSRSTSPCVNCFECRRRQRRR